MAHTPKRCFIISPIGAEGSEMREHADLVREFIIEPAMAELGIYAYRSDHNLSAGRITEQMFGSLLADDMCIAVLTYQNPNVFYELAIAQSAGRPTVIMVEKGATVPFDLHDLRRIEYDFNPRAIRDKVYVNQLIDYVRAIEASDWSSEVPFGKGLSPLGSAQRAVQIYENVREFGGEDRWLDLVGEATSRFCSAGIAMYSLTSHRVRTAMSEKAKAGCEVRIMVMDPENPAFEAMINRDLGQIERIKVAIRQVQRSLDELNGAQPRIQGKLIRRGALHQQLALTDRSAAARLLCFSRSNSDVPVLHLQRPSAIADALDAEFDSLWQAN